MTKPRSNIKSVLVIEDDLSIRDTFREALESEGYYVITAENGREGLEKIQMEPLPCVVLLDMNMPIMSGREFLDALLALPIPSSIPIIVVTASTNAEQARGSTAFIRKPADLDHLLKMVGRHANHN